VDDSFASKGFQQNKVPQKCWTPMLKNAISASHRHFLTIGGRENTAKKEGIGMQ
jgi:hypothetical protein